MTRNTLMGGVSRFAHLAGFARGGARADDDPKDDEPKGRKGSRADDDDDDPKDDEPKGRKGSRADDDDDDPKDDEPKGRKGSRADDDDDDPKDDEPKGRKGSRADDEDMDDEDDDSDAKGKSASARAWRKSQARCAAIFASAAAANNPALAASLAFETTMPRNQAVAVLKAGGGAPIRGARDEGRRRARNPDLDASDAPTGGTQAVAASWDRSLKKVHGKLR